jgi:hypothetical protein
LGIIDVLEGINFTVMDGGVVVPEALFEGQTEPMVFDSDESFFWID